MSLSALAAPETGDLVGHGGEPLLTAGEQDEGWDLGTQPLTPVSKYPSDHKQNFWWLLFKKLSSSLGPKSAFLSYLGTFRVQQQPKNTRHFQDQFWSLTPNSSEILY